MKKTLIIFLLLIGSISVTNANNVDFYGEKNNSWGLGNAQVLLLRDKINLFQNNTGLNTDIVILGKGDKKGCYTNVNFDSCVKNQYGYASDIIIVLKMKSDILDRGDIRSYMDNKNFPIITTGILKSVQDSIVYNFKNNEFTKGLLEYYNNLQNEINYNCNKILKNNKNYGGNLFNTECKVIPLKDVYKQNELLKSEKASYNSFMRNIYIGISIFICILFMIIMHVYYLGRLKKVFKDIKFQLIDLDESKTFKKDIEKTRKDLEKLINKTEVYLANADKIWTKLRIYYIETSKKADLIKSEYEKSVKNFNSQKKLNKQIEDFKNINI